VDVLEATKDTCGQLGAERVPDAVLSLGRCGCGIGTVGVAAGVVDADALLAVDGLARGDVLSDEQIFLAASDEDTRVSVRLL